MFVIITRFSVITKSLSTSWRAGRQDFETYKKTILDEERLKLHLQIFFNYTIPVIKKKSKDYPILHVIVASALLPEWVKEKLDELGKSDVFKVVYLQPEDEFSFVEISKDACMSLMKRSSKNKRKTQIAVMRLDDDDILSEMVFDRLNEFLSPSFAGFCVSFPRGYAGFFSSEKYTKFAELYAPKNAQGLAYIAEYNAEINAFDTKYMFIPGNHTLVDYRTPTILDASFYAYIRTYHGQNDVLYGYDNEKSNMVLKRIFKDIVEIDDVKKSFSVIDIEK